MKHDIQTRVRIFNETKEQLRKSVGKFNESLAKMAEICESGSVGLRKTENQIVRTREGELTLEIDSRRKEYSGFSRRVFFREVAYYIGTKCRDVTVSNAKNVIFDEYVSISSHKEGDPWYQNKMNTYSKLLAEFDFEHVSGLVLKFEEQGDKSELEIYLSKYGHEVTDVLPHILQEPNYSSEFDSIIERRAYFGEQRVLESNEAPSE